jgi:hypothetical protein
MQAVVEVEQVLTAAELEKEVEQGQVTVAAVVLPLLVLV